MSRSLGWTRFTTRPPISISPALMFSRPAIIRSSVDLPQPEGPTSTQNSPSSMATSTPRTTSVGPKDFRTCLRATLAILFAGRILCLRHHRGGEGGLIPMNNYYQALGVSENATPEILKIAFEGKLKALAKGKLSEAERKAEEKLLRQAFGTLSNPAHRAAHDARLEGAADREAASSRTTAIGIVAGVVVALVGGVAWYMSDRSSKLERIRRDEARIAQEAEDLRQRVGAREAEKERRERDASYAKERSELREVDERERVERERANHNEEGARGEWGGDGAAEGGCDQELRVVNYREGA